MQNAFFQLPVFIKPKIFNLFFIFKTKLTNFKFRFLIFNTAANKLKILIIYGALSSFGWKSSAVFIVADLYISHFFCFATSFLAQAEMRDNNQKHKVKIIIEGNESACLSLFYSLSIERFELFCFSSIN